MPLYLYSEHTDQRNECNAQQSMYISTCILLEFVHTCACRCVHLFCFSVCTLLSIRVYTNGVWFLGIDVYAGSVSKLTASMNAISQPFLVAWLGNWQWQYECPRKRERIRLDTCESITAATLSKTNIAPEKSSNHRFSGAMLVPGMVYPVARGT